MTTAKTPSQRGRANRNKGNQAERDVAKYLRTIGWPHCERAVRTGFRTLDRTSADPGDLTGCPGLVFSVKDAQVERLDPWLAELDAMCAAPALIDDVTGLLIHKRPRHLPDRWWCWLRVYDLLFLTSNPLLPSQDVSSVPVRMELGHVVPLLRRAGYGSPIEAAS